MENENNRRNELTLKINGKDFICSCGNSMFLKEDMGLINDVVTCPICNKKYNLIELARQ